MVQVLFLQQPNGEFLELQMTRHSGLAEEGPGILRAVVSSAVYLVANVITDVVQIKADFSVLGDDTSLRIPEKAVFLCRTLLQGLRLHLMGPQEQYPGNIRIDFTEV